MVKIEAKISLPDPESLLNTDIANDAIREMNKQVANLFETRTMRSPYLKATPEQKAIVTKCTSKNGIVHAIR